MIFADTVVADDGLSAAGDQPADHYCPPDDSFPPDAPAYSPVAPISDRARQAFIAIGVNDT